MRRLWAIAVSMRTTAVLIAALSVFMLLNVLLPQAQTNPAAFGAALRRGAAARFVLETLRLGHVSTHPAFLLTLVVFLANLAAVLADRIGGTVRRLRLAPPAPGQRNALLEGAAKASVAGAVDDVTERATRILETLGYRVSPIGRGELWAVRHRWALLGFPVFHAAFFLLALGGGLVYWTRDVVAVGACEGQEVSSATGGVERRAPAGPADPVTVAVDRVDVKLEGGKPIDLSVAMRLLPAGVAGTARINHPLVSGDLSVLVDRAGIAPVLWVVDRDGFTRDRVAVMAVSNGDLPARAPLDGGAVEAVLEPIAVGLGFPERAVLEKTRVSIRLREQGREVFSGRLAPGEGADLGDRVVRLQEIRYWASLRLIRERGGGVLVAGFLFAVFGISWRMLWHRREIVVVVSEGRVRLGGRSELYPRRFRAELQELLDLLAEEREVKERA